ncbi:hypothetical protein DVH24_007124 [Malus domestica]|uniref:Uncharacterized protein n=1 Tax=Malus domestica TaxID=3750 RepID=A0A498HEH2_MALDO|nr:hypothetical protein DVH24_007124 [Malus domestica]
MLQLLRRCLAVDEDMVGSRTAATGVELSSSSLRFIAEHPTISLVDSYSTLRALKQIHSQPLVNGVLNDPHLSGHFVAAIALRNRTNLY